MVIDGWGRALSYMACAISIMVAVGTTALLFAALGCSALVVQSLDG